MINTVLAFSDIDGTVREWELPDLTANVSNPAMETLVAIEDGGRVSVPKLTEQSGQAKSTVARHVTQLAESEVITTWQKGKTNYAKVSFTGRLWLRADGRVEPGDR